MKYNIAQFNIEGMSQRKMFPFFYISTQRVIQVLRRGTLLEVCVLELTAASRRPDLLSEALIQQVKSLILSMQFLIDGIEQEFKIARLMYDLHSEHKWFSVASQQLLLEHQP